MDEPRTIAGRALISGTRPHVRRALARTVIEIETQAAAPYRDVLAMAGDVLAQVVAAATGADDPETRRALAARAAGAHRAAMALLSEEEADAPNPSRA